MDVKHKKREQPFPLNGSVAREIIAILGQGVTHIDTDGRFEYVNPAYARMDGRSPAALPGQTPADI